MSTDDVVSRRTFIRTAGGAAGVAGRRRRRRRGPRRHRRNSRFGQVGPRGTSGPTKTPAGREEVTVQVGAGDQGLAFDPTLLWVDPGTTITFEWTGNGGAHNVQNVEGPASLDSGDPVGEEGYTYEYETSEEDVGITHYHHCVPHTAVGMHAGLAVGEDIETESTGGGGGSNAVFVPRAPPRAQRRDVRRDDEHARLSPSSS